MVSGNLNRPGRQGSNSNQKLISDESDYRDVLFGLTEKDFGKKLWRDCSEEAVREALESSLNVALEERRFEIGNYWKRNNYFLLIIGAIATGYIALINSSGMAEKPGLIGIKEVITYFILPSLGFIFSLGWCLASLGSKYWQENWETQVNLLEKMLGRRVHWMVLETGFGARRSPLSARAFSVSKINQFLSYVLTLSWFVILVYSVHCRAISMYPDSPEEVLIFYPLVLFLAMILGFWFVEKVKSELGSPLKIYSKILTPLDEERNGGGGEDDRFQTLLRPLFNWVYCRLEGANFLIVSASGLVILFLIRNAHSLTISLTCCLWIEVLCLILGFLFYIFLKGVCRNVAVLLLLICILFSVCIAKF
ncbi:RipA family octameric membrane protein [Dermabacteraceae bacterium P13264]